MKIINIQYFFQIVALNESLQSVRTEQQSLDHELDFVSGQQRELEELLVPLERELSNVIITDPEREQTYYYFYFLSFLNLYFY